MLYAFVVLGLVSSVPSQEIGWEERLQNDLFSVLSGTLNLNSVNIIRQSEAFERFVASRLS